MFAGGYSASAMALEAPKPSSVEYSIASTSAVPPAKRPSLSRRPRIEASSDSGRRRQSPTLRNDFCPGTSPPSPGESTESEDIIEVEEEDDDNQDEDEFIPSARRAGTSRDARKRRSTVSRRASSSSGAPKRHTSETTRRQMVYDPSAVFELNEEHTFFLVTVVPLFYFERIGQIFDSPA